MKVARQVPAYVHVLANFEGQMQIIEKRIRLIFALPFQGLLRVRGNICLACNIHVKQLLVNITRNKLVFVIMN